MRVERIQIPERPLIDAYRNDFQRVAEFFQYNPMNPDSFKDRYDYLQRCKFPRAEVTDALASYNAAIGAASHTMENIQRLREEKTVAVITGQQAGVLTGPLYTIYKALTAVQLAERLSADGMPAVPVFWIASEDHDFLEISAASFLNREHQVVDVSLRAETGRKPAGRLNLQAEVAEFLNELAAATTDTDFKPALLAELSELARQSASLADWFGQILAWLLRETGIIFVDALDPALRRLGQGFFLEVFQRNEEITSTLQATDARLKEAGFPLQVQTGVDQVHLFLIANDHRYPLEKVDGGFSLRGREGIFSSAEISQWIEREPENTSTNVVTRPLFQDMIFPTVAYIGGPGETAYYAQYRQVYALFNMQMPIIYPRASLTLVEKAIAKTMDKQRVTASEVLEKFEEVRASHLAQVDVINIPGKFQEFKKRFIPEYRRLIQELNHLDAKFHGLGSENLNRIVQEINYLEDKAQQQHRKNCEELLGQLNKIKLNLMPGDNFQERRLNIFMYLFKYQLAFIHELSKLDMLQPNCHQIVYL